MDGKQPQYIKASELGTFGFCRRAWFLDRKGAPSSLTVERQDGRAAHQTHAAEVAQAETTARASSIVLVIAVLVIVGALLTWWILR